MEGLGGSSTSLSNLFHVIPLVLKVDGLGVPVVNLVWYCVKGHDLVWYYVEGHDLFHKGGRDSCSEEADQDIVVCNASMGGVTLESRDVTFQ